MDFSLAISKDGELLLETHRNGTGRDSDRLLADWLIQCFDSCGLTITDADHWSVGTGPGSFAGLRCGLAMVKGICLGSGAAMRGMPSVYALARDCKAAFPNASLVGVLNDGRRGQLILSRFAWKDGNEMPFSAGDAVPVSPDDLLRSEYVCEAWATCQESLLPPLPSDVDAALLKTNTISARHLLDISDDFAWPATVEERERSTTPIYVRQPVFVRPAELRTDL